MAPHKGKKLLEGPKMNLLEFPAEKIVIFNPRGIIASFTFGDKYLD